LPCKMVRESFWSTNHVNQT